MSISQKILDRFMQAVKDNREKQKKTGLPKTKVDKELENYDTDNKSVTGKKDGTGLTEDFSDLLTPAEKARAGKEYEHMDAEELGRKHAKSGKKPESPYKKGSTMHGDYMRGHYNASRGMNEANKKKVDGKEFADQGLVNEADKDEDFAEQGLVNEADKNKKFAEDGLVNEHKQQMKEQSAFSTGLFDGTNGKDYANPHDEGSKEHKHYHIGHEIGHKTRSKTRGRAPTIPGTLDEGKKTSAKEIWDEHRKKGVVAGIDKDQYPPIKGMEGPYRKGKAGHVLYYDPKEGKYYDSKKDMYIDHDEAKSMGLYEANDVVHARNLSTLNKHIPGKGSPSTSEETPAQKAYKLGKQHKAESKPHSNPHSSDTWEHDQYNAGYGH